MSAAVIDCSRPTDLPIATISAAPSLLRRIRTFVGTPVGGVVLLVIITTAARIALACALGLGIDESYMVAAGRTLRLGYFDHPPAAWWLAWSGAHLFGSDAALFVRLPFVALFALSTVLMYRLSADLFGARAGLWAAVMFNAAPIFGIAVGCWVLPDGPLVAALLGAVLCLRAALASPDRPSWGWWIGAGLCAGLALFSKYTAILTLAGAFLYLVSEPHARKSLTRPQPWIAALIAFAVFTPVLVWNAQNGWASLLFQLGRAGSSRFHPFGPLSTLAGEAAFLLPWIWLPMMVLAIAALRRGPRDRKSWLLICLAAPPILLFLALSVRSHILFHWAAPGYLMLFPLLGEAIARLRHRRKLVHLYLGFTALVVGAGAALVGTEVRYNWLPDVVEHFALGSDPDLDAVDWTSVRDDLTARGLLDPTLIVATTRWHDAGKIDYALGGNQVICLGSDAREYGLITNSAELLGRDMLILAPRETITEIRAQFGAAFDSIGELPSSTVAHGGRPAMIMPIFIGRRYHPAAAPHA